MILSILISLLWIFYALFEGFREGYYWYNRNNSIKKDNLEIHPYFAIQRGIVISLSVLPLIEINLFMSFIYGISLMFTFSYFHNGMYYLTRNNLDNKLYQLKWKDQSTTSTAKLTKIMTYNNRLIFMIIGVVIQMVSIYYFILA